MRMYIIMLHPFLGIIISLLIDIVTVK